MTINGTINQELCIEPKINHLLYKNGTSNQKLAHLTENSMYI